MKHLQSHNSNLIYSPHPIDDIQVWQNTNNWPLHQSMFTNMMLKLPGASTCFTSCSQSQGARRGDIAERRVLDLDSREEVSNTQSSRTERKESSSLSWEKTRQGPKVLVLESRWTRVRLASDMSNLQLFESKGSKKCCFKSLTSLASGSSRRPAW